MTYSQDLRPLDEALAEHPATPETAVSTATPRKCRRHQWEPTDRQTYTPEGAPRTLWACARCGSPKDETRSRRGKSSRRLGGDQERRAERRYGWTKIGERGEKTDLRGRLFKVQQKSTRKAAPALIRDTFAGLEATRDGRVPLLLLTFVRQGIPAEDYIVIRGSDWLELHGRDEEDTHA